LTHSNCVGWGVKKDKIVLVVPPFSSSVPPPNTFFPGTALTNNTIYFKRPEHEREWHDLQIGSPTYAGM